MLQRLLRALASIASRKTGTQKLSEGMLKIFSWELARPRRYVTPIPYTRVPGQVGWVKLGKQMHIFDNLRFEKANIDNTSTSTPQS